MDKDTLKDDLEDFSACKDAEEAQRKAALDDLEFSKLGKQWHPEDEAQRKNDGRPCLTINRCPAFTKQVTNDARMNEASIHVQPVGDGADKATSDVLSDLIRNIETQSQAPIVYETAFDFAVNCGVGYFRVNVDYTCEDAWDQDIFLERIANPFTVYGDYESNAATSIDWNRAYVTEFYSKKKFEARWGTDKKASSIETGSSDYSQDWFKEKQIRVAERWLREEVPAKLLKLSNDALMLEDKYLELQEILAAQGVSVTGDRETTTYKVLQRIITGTDILETNDWLGKYIPIVPMYGEEINVNGKRHFISLIRRAKDAQRLYNYQRTLAAELGGLQTKTPWMGPVGMFNTDSAKWSTANRTSHAYLEYDIVQEQPGAVPQRIPFTGPPAGVMNEAMMASDDMKAIMGLYDASLGARSNETSGKAIMARQREGDTSTFDFLDNRNRAVEHGGRIILDLIPKVYKAERIMRAVKEDGQTYTVPVNQPVAPPQQLQAVMQGQPMPPQNQEQGGPPQYAPVPQEMPPMHPEQMAQLKAITKVFDLTTGKYDVTVTAGPSFTSRREEAATQMMEFIRVFPQAAGLIGDLLAKNLDWPGAEQVAERLKAMIPPQAQGQINPMVQRLQQMLQQQGQQAQAQIAQLTQQVNDKRAEYELKSKELQVKMAEAETKRMEVMKPESQQQPDPFEAQKLQIEAQKLEIEAKKLEISAYEAETARIAALNPTMAPEQITALINQTVMAALASGGLQGPQAAVVPVPVQRPPDPEEPEPALADGPPSEPPSGGFSMPGQEATPPGATTI